MEKVFGIRTVFGDTLSNFKSVRFTPNSCAGNNPRWRYGCITHICWSWFKSNLVRNRQYQFTRSGYWCSSGKIRLRQLAIPFRNFVQKFINAGADAIISNTFFVNHTNLETELKMSEEQASETLLGLLFFSCMLYTVYHYFNFPKTFISDTLNIAKEAVGDNDTIVIGDIGPVADGPDTCYYPSYLARYDFLKILYDFYCVEWRLMKLRNGMKGGSNFLLRMIDVIYSAVKQ